MKFLRISGKDTLFTLLMRDAGSDAADFKNARRLLFGLLATHSKSLPPGKLPNWTYSLVKQLLVPNSCDLTSRSMKEFIDLTSKIKDNFAEAIKTILEDDEVTVLSQNTNEITKILVSILQNTDMHTKINIYITFHVILF